MSDQNTAPWCVGAAVTSAPTPPAAGGLSPFTAEEWFAPAAPLPGIEAVVPVSVAAEVARRRRCVWRQQRFWMVVAQRDLPPPAAVFVGEYSGVTEAYLGDPDAELTQLRWWMEAIHPAVLSVVRAPDKDTALEIVARGPLLGEVANEVQVMVFVPGAGRLAGLQPRQTSMPELMGLLAGWQLPPAAPGASAPDAGEGAAAAVEDGVVPDACEVVR